MEFLKATPSGQPENYVDKYKKEQEIKEKLEQFYPSNERSPFWGFYTEWEVVLVWSEWNSQVFDYKDGQLTPKWRQFDDIRKLGDFYLWIAVKSDKSWNLGPSREKTYTVIDKNWNEFKQMRGEVWTGDNIPYIEIYFPDKNSETHAYYDENLNLIADNINVRTSEFLAYKNGECLFTPRFKWDTDNPKFFVVSGWKEWDGTFLSLEELQNSPLYQEYILQKIEKELEIKKYYEKLENLPLKYSIEKNGEFLEKITDENGKEVFAPEEWYKYKIAYPHMNTEASVPEEYRDKQALLEKKYVNQWIFIVEKFDATNMWQTPTEILYNFNRKQSKLLEATEDEGYSIRDGLFIHRIDENTSEIYTIVWEKVGTESIKLEWDDGFNIFRNDAGKNQLIEQETGIIHEQEFDKYLKTYKEGDKVIVIVENDGIIKQIVLGLNTFPMESAITLSSNKKHDQVSENPVKEDIANVFKESEDSEN